jgi:hypothetical protein
MHKISEIRDAEALELSVLLVLRGEVGLSDMR